VLGRTIFQRFAIHDVTDELKILGEKGNLKRANGIPGSNGFLSHPIRSPEFISSAPIDSIHEYNSSKSDPNIHPGTLQWDHLYDP
jgi:hypothetical protein